jgi:S-adenosylmethionine:diacylglycerol 3-amino-3-carboxypropyl transferase
MNRFQRVILTISSFVVLGLLLNVLDSLKLYNLESKAGIKEFLFHTLLSGILFSLIWELIWPKFKRLIQKSIKDK